MYCWLIKKRTKKCNRPSGIFFEFRGIPRFYFLVFAWQKNDTLFHKRKNIAKSSLFRSGLAHKKQSTEYMSLDQQYSYHMLMAYTSMFFIEGQCFIPGQLFSFYNQKEDSSSTDFVVMNDLNLKDVDNEESKITTILSVFPVHLFD